jgi:hypothetical protein
LGFAWLALVVALGLSPTAGWADATQEYRVKAAFLLNFTRFVEWPPERAETGAPFVIGVLGRNPFGAELERVVEARVVAGRPIEVRHLARAIEAEGVDLLFVGEGEERRLGGAVEALRRAGLLTVGETDHFLAAGGAIGFHLVDGRVRFAINLDAAERNGLRVSAQLQKLATVVHRSR